MGQEQHQQRNAQTYREIDVKGLTDVGQRGIYAFFHEQIPLEFGDIVHIEQMQAVAVPELIGAGLFTQDAVDDVAQARRCAQVGFLTSGLVAEQDGLAVRIHEIDGALETLLIIRDEVAHGIHSEPDAGGAEKAPVEVEDTIVDEDGQCIPVGQVGIDIDLVGFRHGAYPVVPDVAGCLRRHLLQDALAGVVVGATLGDEEAAECAVARFDLLQITDHGADVLLPAHDPVAQEGVVRHGRRDEHGPHQILLDLRIDIARGERQFLGDDGIQDRLLRHVVAAERGGEEAGCQQDAQPQEQALTLENTVC